LAFPAGNQLAFKNATFEVGFQYPVYLTGVDVFELGLSNRINTIEVFNPDQFLVINMAKI